MMIGVASLVMLTIVAATGLLGGCQFRQLKKEIADYDASFALVGQVSVPVEHKAPVVVVVLLKEYETERVPLQYTF